MSDRPPTLRLHDVSAGYGRKVVVEHVDLTVHGGSVTALVGVNGSGKTTLLRTILGLLRPLSGRVERLPVGVGYVPQIDRSESLVPVTAREVVLMGLTTELGVTGRADAAVEARAEAALARFDVADLGARMFGDLSGGQRQRVLLARALVGDPELLVLDEPVRGLDIATGARLVDLLTNLSRDDGLAIIVSTHALDLVANHADQVALFRDGRVTAGAADDVLVDDVLSEYLGEPVRVGVVAGRRVVVPVGGSTR